jgi:acyl-coenzyme A synthetase/AMP-(fatty) acid ligase
MGTLKIKGDSAALCYWNAHEKSKETFAGDWCTTGDQFHLDDEGYYWYHGRTDDMLKVSGIFVAPAEIENCLLQHEAVLECAVIGFDSGDGLVKPKAFVVIKAEVQSPIRTGSRSDRVSSGVQSPDDRSGSPTIKESALSPEALAEELKDFVKSHLAPYKYPRWIEFVSSLPKNDRGKIDRKKLKTQLAKSR